MTRATEVKLTSRRAARWQQWVVGISLVAAIGGAAVAIVSDPQWWVILIWVVTSLILLLLLVGVWTSASESAAATEMLQATGIVTRANVIAGETIDEDDEVRYILTLEIRPVGQDPFTVTHRCTNLRCKDAAHNAPTTITTLVDASTSTWAVVHG